MRNLKSALISVCFLLSATAVAWTQDVHEAAKAGDLAKVKMLLEKDRSLVDLKDENGRTPLHWAARGVHLEVLQYLVEKGANVNALDANGIAPLHSVSLRGHVAPRRRCSRRGQTSTSRIRFVTPPSTMLPSGDRKPWSGC